MRKLATELKVDAQTIRTATKDDLKLKSYAITHKDICWHDPWRPEDWKNAKKSPYLNETSPLWKFSCVKRCLQLILYWITGMKDTLHTQKLMSKALSEWSNPAQVMVFKVVASNGKKMPMKFYKPGEKVNANAYYKTLRYNVLPWLKANYPEGKNVWTLEDVPAHTAKKSTEFLQIKFLAITLLSLFQPRSQPLRFCCLEHFRACY